MSIFSSFRALWTAGRGIVVGMPAMTPESNPLELFQAWYRAAEKSGLFMPEAMALSTASPGGRPSSRMVLLKTADERGFVFFTNYESRKSNELDANPHASLLFHWPILQRQVRVEGRVERVSRDESDAYFQSRSRRSQIGAWASRQSRPLASRADLEEAARAQEAAFRGQDVPLPPHWGGWLVRPERMEFWQGRPFRLHDRLVFVRAGGEAAGGFDEKNRAKWEVERLYP